MTKLSICVLQKLLIVLSKQTYSKQRQRMTSSVQLIASTAFLVSQYSSSPTSSLEGAGLVRAFITVLFAASGQYRSLVLCWAHIERRDALERSECARRRVELLCSKIFVHPFLGSRPWIIVSMIGCRSLFSSFFLSRRMLDHKHYPARFIVEFKGSKLASLRFFFIIVFVVLFFHSRKWKIPGQGKNVSWKRHRRSPLYTNTLTKLFLSSHLSPLCKFFSENFGTINRSFLARVSIFGRCSAQVSSSRPIQLTYYSNVEGMTSQLTRL